MATYYINADTGNDSTGAGTSVSPWLLLSKAVTSASNGDTIICQASTASFTLASQTISKLLTIKANTYGDAIFSGGGSHVAIALSATTITFQNLKFTNIAQTSKVPIFSCRTTGNTYTWTNCTFYNLAAWSDATPNDGGIIQDNTTAGVIITLTSCLFYDIKKSVSANAGVIIEVWSATLTMTNCTIYISATGTSAMAQIFRNRNSSTFAIKNCIIANFSGLTVTCGNTSGFTYCDVYSLTTPPSGTGVITTDPLFVDASNSNFNLRPTSPCIDTGSL